MLVMRLSIDRRKKKGVSTSFFRIPTHYLLKLLKLNTTVATAVNKALNGPEDVIFSGKEKSGSYYDFICKFLSSFSTYEYCNTHLDNVLTMVQ